MQASSAQSEDTSVVAMIGNALLVLLAFGALGWSALALHYTGPGPRALRDTLAALSLVAPPAAGLALQSFAYAMLTIALVFSVALARFLWIRPPQHADWQPNVAELPRAELAGDILTIHNLRNFEYRSKSDYTPRWETRTYDLSKLVGLDMFFSHWSSPAIAHTIMSWPFSDGSHLAISIETRNRAGQRYSAIAGFFRQFPIYYVVADERDVIRLRTNHRHERVWLYRLQAPAGVPRSLLLEYIETVNRLAERSAWYNALTDNCTTTIRTHVHHLSPGGYPWSWRLIANGYLPELLYEENRLDRSLPFDELREISSINARAEAASQAGFSREIRVGLPGAALTQNSTPMVGHATRHRPAGD
jgi:hypothetical protein